MREHPLAAVTAAAEEALRLGSPRSATVTLLLRQQLGLAVDPVAPVSLARMDLRTEVSSPDLSAYAPLGRPRQ